MFLTAKDSKVTKVLYSEIVDSCVDLYLKREDFLHPFISGNKYRKLTYNLEKAKELGNNTLLTFGGAYSNHIAAVAYAGNSFGFKTIGIIRGDELAKKIMNNEPLNPTLKFATEHGMELNFVSREAYKNKDSQDFITHCQESFGNFYLIPEGGSNELAVKGCEEILNENDQMYDYICVSVGTGGTISGIINASKKHQHVIGFAAVNAPNIIEEIKRFTKKSANWQLYFEDHFGGYGKVNEDLINFINRFKEETDIQLDTIYTGKMMFRIIDLIKKNHFPKNTKILAIHTGGLQGIAGMNELLKKKKMTLINS